MTATLILIKVSLLLGVALLAGRVLRGQPAARRHGLWSAAFIAILLLPALAVTLPVLPVSFPAWFTAGTSTVAGSRPEVPTVAGPRLESLIASESGRLVSNPIESSVAAPAARRPTLRATLVAIWIAGTIVALIGLAVSMGRVHRLAASSTRLDTVPWHAASTRIAAQLGFARDVRILASSSIATPMAGGFVHPTVFVPADAREWSVERREVVLAHEISHLASRDPLRHLVSRFAFAVYWFHPLAWIAARRAEAAREQACDEAVLALGIRPSVYARILLDFADRPPLAFATTALPIVRAGSLETRLMAILNGSTRPAAARRAFIPAVGLAAVTLSIAAAQPSRSAPVSGDHIEKPASVRPRGASTVAPGPVFAPSARPVMASRTAAAESACRWDGRDPRPFNGTMSSSDRGGTTIVYEQVGWRGGDRVIQKSFGDLRVCAIAEGLGSDAGGAPREWISRATRVILETERPNETRRMEIAGGRVTWTVNGAASTVDGTAQAWRDALVPVLDFTWELTRLSGEVSTLRGEISTILGERSTIQGEISTLRGQVSTMQGEISTLRGEESTLRGEISTIRGHVSTLQGQISTERGAISSLTASLGWERGQADRDRLAARIRDHEDAIREIEGRIARYDANARVRDVERQIARLDIDRRAEEIERQIREFDVEGRVAGERARLANLQVERRVNSIESDIARLNAGTRSRSISTRLDESVILLRRVLNR